MNCRYSRPESIAEAVSILRDAQVATAGEAHLVAGGVALGILMNEKLLEPRWFVDISRLSELKGIELTEEGGLRIGAACRHREVERSPLIVDRYPILAEMAAEIACGRIKNRGTIGGNICLADPQGDPPIAAIALRASLRALGPDGARDIPATEFFTGLYETALQRDEILQEIRLPPPAPNEGAAFGKFSARRAMDYSSTVSVAVRLQRDPASEQISDVGLGLGGSGEVPVWAKETEKALLGRRPNDECFALMRETLFAEIEPLADDLYSQDYKRHVAAVIMKRTVKKAWERSGGAA